ncbi:sortase domain-containing protein [Neobacillus rhizophilus]|uniref:sortase domain-containing protein n=1 Tax=Neobacillus rhizophilus TaxID=2833579 RepID=UPI0035580987
MLVFFYALFSQAVRRDTVFRKFGELEPSDIFILEFPYGTFKYKMASSKIVDKNDRTIIRKAGKEELVLSTRSILSAKRRNDISFMPIRLSKPAFFIHKKRKF